MQTFITVPFIVYHIYSDINLFITGITGIKPEWCSNYLSQHEHTIPPRIMFNQGHALGSIMVSDDNLLIFRLPSTLRF